MNIEIPPGYGLRPLGRESWQKADLSDPTSFTDQLLDKLMVWEAPKGREGHRYIIGVDVSGGLGLDRSVVDVYRAPTITQPIEQVAQFVSDSVSPTKLAYIIDPIGRFYSDEEGQEALLAIECNNHGLGTQSELQGHLGYSNFYIWQYFDRRDPRRRHSNAFGWYTTRRTRPWLIEKFVDSINEVDPLTGLSDCVINSPFTISELRDFQSSGTLAEAEAAPGAHDDAIMAAAIAIFVSSAERYSETEPLNEQRRRLHEEKLRKQFVEGQTGVKRDYQNTLCSADEMWGGEERVYEREEREG